MSDASSDTSGVGFPPPLHYAGGFVAGVGAHRLVPGRVWPEPPAIASPPRWGPPLAGGLPRPPARDPFPPAGTTPHPPPTASSPWKRATAPTRSRTTSATSDGSPATPRRRGRAGRRT